MFRVADDVWYHVISRRVTAMTKWGDQLNVGRAAVGSDSPVADRLAEMIDFFEFLLVLIPEAMERWRDRRGTR
jgi:hypothetical protein